MPTTETSVLVVGGGLNGLASALFLSQHGIGVELVEKNAHTANLLRAAGVSARTMELFATVGIEPEIREKGLKLVPGVHWREKHSPKNELPRAILGANQVADIGNDRAFVMEEGTIEVEGASPRDPVWCGQDKFEPLIVREAEKLGAKLHFRTELVSWEQDTDGVTSVVRDLTTGEERTIRSQYLIAADGVTSPVREKLEIERTGHGTLGHVMSILFEADLDSVVDGRRFLICYLLNETAGLLHRFDEKRWIFGLFWDPKRYGDENPTFEQGEEYVRKATGISDLPIKVELVSKWRLAEQVAVKSRAGRVFLVGDSAHVHPPAGGYGANSGMQDAHNLAWKLAAVLRGWAGDGLLDSYEDERLPVGRATAYQAYLRQTNRSEGDGGHPDMRNSTVITTGYTYNSECIVGGTGGEPLETELKIDGRPGLRVPHTWLTQAGTQVSTAELAVTEFVLLAGADGEEWKQSAETVAADLGVPLKAYRVAEDGDLTDKTGTFLANTGITSTGAVLVRPDGFVGWRATDASTDPKVELQHALLKITARS